ncbi:MAG: leucine-rich repeat domain-containing protein [Candidatus Poribacteria bacterium]|nr:leucine-rich repeat domain-containing protein [Candidatus Poribacteria bacterium]
MLRMKLLTCVFTFWVVLLTIPLVASAQTVNIPDPNLRDAIADTLNKQQGVVITKDDMETLVNLEARDREITDLTGLAFATNLQELDLRNNVINDISELTELNELSQLRLGENAITDISPLNGKITLEVLTIDNNSISELSPLSSLVNLEVLNISNNVIDDISPLSSLIRLVEITMNNNLPVDLSPLEGLISLRRFHSSETRIIDFTALANLPKLQFITINNGEISDLTPLAGLIGLRELHLPNNDIEDIKPLETLTGLTRLSLNQNEISDVTPLAALHNLIFVNLENNDIEDFLPLNTAIRRGAIILRNNNPGFIVDAPKIRGPWLWVIVPTGELSGSEAADSDTDFLAQATDGEITEKVIATQGAVEGDSVGKKRWKIGRLSRNGGNNINELVNEIGLGIDDINHHVAYGSIILDSPREQSSTMYVGSGDAVKVWLNGELAHKNAVDRDADDYQDTVGVALKKGENILLVAVYEGKGWWSGFFGLDPAAEVDVRLPNYRIPDLHPADINGDGKVDILDMIRVARSFGILKPGGSPADINNDNVVDIRDLISVAQHIDDQSTNVSAAPLSPTLVQEWITLAWAEFDGSIEFQKGISNLEEIYKSLVSEKPTEIPARKTELFANFPNPFNPETWIPYQLAAPANVTLTIHSATGAIVRTLSLGQKSEGVYKTRHRAAHWDGKDQVGENVASGIYFYTLTAGNFTATRKMLILK